MSSFSKILKKLSKNRIVLGVVTTTFAVGVVFVILWQLGMFSTHKGVSPPPSPPPSPSPPPPCTWELIRRNECAYLDSKTGQRYKDNIWVSSRSCESDEPRPALTKDASHYRGNQEFVPCTDEEVDATRALLKSFNESFTLETHMTSDFPQDAIPVVREP
jgi:hypothetical protein